MEVRMCFRHYMSSVVENLSVESGVESGKW